MAYIKTTQLYIVGTGSLEEELKAKVKHLKINNIKFLGFKSGNELEDIIKNSKFTIVPSQWYENCPMTILESMAYGKCVIGSNCGGIPELVRDDVNGVIFESGNKNDLIKKIKYLLDNPLNTKQLGIRARYIAENEYNKDIHFKRVMEIYNEVLGNIPGRITDNLKQTSKVHSNKL